MCHLACPASALCWTFWPENEAKWEESNVRNCSVQFCALENAHPCRDFAGDLKAQILGGTERSTEALGLWTSSLKMLNLRGLESANVAKAKIAKSLP